MSFPYKLFIDSMRFQSESFFCKAWQVEYKRHMEPFPPFFFLFPNLQFQSIETGTGSLVAHSEVLEPGENGEGINVGEPPCTVLEHPGKVNNIECGITDWRERTAQHGFSEPVGAVNLRKRWPGTVCLRKEIVTCLKALLHKILMNCKVES